VTRFFPLPIEISKLNALSLSWTLVHNITEDSPLFAYTRADLEQSRMEVLVYIKAFDDHFSNIVQQRTSYIYKQLVYGAKFLPMFERSEDGTYTVLELDKINAHELVALKEEVVV
jgi:inward rectifier potassium channel